MRRGAGHAVQSRATTRETSVVSEKHEHWSGRYTYETKEYEPRPEDERGEERRHGLRGDALLGAEGVRDLGARREGDLVGVRRGWLRGGHVQVEELILRG